MNIPFFGKIIVGLGVALLLIGIVTTVSSLETKYSFDEYADRIARSSILGRAKKPTQGDYNIYLQNLSYAHGEQMACAYSRIGGRGCPMGGFAALFTYAGLFISVIGGGLVLASRKSKTA